jgi:hypothetical protein
MSDLVEQNILADEVDDDDDDWQPISVPIEEDPFFTPEEVERIRLKAANMNASNSVTMSFEQLYALMEVFKKGSF